MSLAELLSPLQASPAFRACLDRLSSTAGGRLPLSVADAAKPYVLAALHAALDRPLLVVTARPNDARSLRDEIACWHPSPDDVLLFPEHDALPFESLPPDSQTTADRLAVLTRLANSSEFGPSTINPKSQTPNSPLVVVSARAAADLLTPPASFAAASIRVRVGERIRPEALLARCLELGYEPSPVVDSPGQYGRRGGIVDVYPLVGDPCRIEFFGDEIDSLRAFDPLTQRSNFRIEQLLITPSADRAPGTNGQASFTSPDGTARAGVLSSPASGEGSGRGVITATLLDYLPPVGLVALDERDSIAAAAHELERQVEGLRQDLVERGALAPDAPPPFVTWDALAARLDERPGLRVELDHDPDDETIPFVYAPAFAGRLRHFLEEHQRLAHAGERVVIVTQQAERLRELLGESENANPAPTLPLSHSPVLIQGQLREGWRSPALGLTVFTDSEIFGWQKIRRPARPRRSAGRQTFLTELTPGDLVVHVDHGIAYYRGMTTLSADAYGERAERSDGDNRREYLLLEYAEGGHLYVPADQADRVSRYVGAGDATPSPSKLGSGEWQRAKSRVRRAVREIAHDLLQLYAAREHNRGYGFPPDTAWQAELEASFPYVETPDQLRALTEVKHDMEAPRPMDRLLVGDVGYGKTEIALRAAFKAVEAGKQVAILVPTTVLAQQHWNTFRERLAAFPINVEMLSRFRNDREQRQVVGGLADGSVDICIGTHRLLQKDVVFKDLGLVIIDEEQRFGVTHKERLKQLRSEVDVLTLTATPIPRTLHMALVGVRDMSTIETPPEERQPVRTYVTEYDDGLIREVILRELDRGGQVYYVHNRVQSIEYEARRLRKLVPEARITIGHGQMPEEQLERVMLEFSDGRHDVLVCTTIIESGLDIPSVNTLIVNNAHRFGLSQLYQLRGRVGRSAARAYAYFLYVRDTALSETAEKRLRTIFEATELGAGFRIALKDLEIRGAGNLLGAEQHGHISSVGFDLYTRLLAEAVTQLKEVQEQLAGDHPAYRRARERARSVLTIAPLQNAPSVTLPVSAYLPTEYIADEPTRLSFYQRFAAITRGEQLTELLDELADRFGPLPPEAQNLAYVVSLRLAAQQRGVQQIQAADGEVVVRFERLPRLDLAGLSRRLGAPVRAGSNQLRLPRGSGQGWMVTLQTLVENLPPAG